MRGTDFGRNACLLDFVPVWPGVFDGCRSAFMENSSVLSLDYLGAEHEFREIPQFSSSRQNRRQRSRIRHLFR
jgi:hypothetical protein